MRESGGSACESNTPLPLRTTAGFEDRENHRILSASWMSPPHDLHLQFRIYQMHVSRFTRYADTCALDAAGEGGRLRQ